MKIDYQKYVIAREGPISQVTHLDTLPVLAAEISCPPPATTCKPTIRLATISGFLFVAVCLTYLQSLHYPFINFDDPYYVTANEHVLRGLNLDAVQWAFTHRHSNNWHPLTSMSHMLDCQFFGICAGGHHAVNLFLHLATTIGLFLVLCKSTGNFWPSAAVAAFFAVHPLHVESVAWVSERKDVLSGLCFVLALWAYLSYAQRPFSLGRYLLVTLIFGLGLLAKSMLVTLPVVLLLLDYWPLRRVLIEREKGRNGASGIAPSATLRLAAYPVRLSLRVLLLEKLPWLAMSAAFGLVTIRMQAEFALPLSVIPLRYRIAHAAVSYVTYLRQTIWSFGLALFYPYPENGDSLTDGSILACLLAAITLFAFNRRQKRPYLLVGWLWYLVTLLPTVGLVQVGLQAHADQYMYLPSIGLFVAVAWETAALIAACRKWRRVAAMVAAATLAALTIAANKQAAYWQSSESLWRHAIQCTRETTVPTAISPTCCARKATSLRPPKCMRKAWESTQSFPKDTTAWLRAGCGPA